MVDMLFFVSSLADKMSTCGLCTYMGGSAFGGRLGKHNDAIHVSHVQTPFIFKAMSPNVASSCKLPASLGFSQKGISDETMSETTFWQISDIRSCQYLWIYEWNYMAYWIEKSYTLFMHRKNNRICILSPHLMRTEFAFGILSISLRFDKMFPDSFCWSATL